MEFMQYAEGATPPIESWDELQCCICLALPVHPCSVPHAVDVPEHEAHIHLFPPVCALCYRL
jgi:hypothetical protein